MHHHVGTQLAQVLDEVIGKGIVVVDHEQHILFITLLFNIFSLYEYDTHNSTRLSQPFSRHFGIHKERPCTAQIAIVPEKADP
jgi:hypothetical protein